jgi:uracil-DNA glycosylase
MASVCGTRTRQAWREPHGQALHRRLCRRSAVRDARRIRLSKGRYDARIDDGLTLDGAIIVNSVKCLPPQNKPTPQEIANCRPLFEAQLSALPTVRVIIALGRIAHDAVLRASE